MNIDQYVKNVEITSEGLKITLINGVSVTLFTDLSRKVLMQEISKLNL